MNGIGRCLWHMPYSFEIAPVLGANYSLRSVLFHDISDTESSFTEGLNGTITRQNFETALRFLKKHYSPVSLEQVLASFDGRALPPRPVLVTFDDAYVSVSEFAAPLCAELGIPGAFFVNASCLDNQQLALDNLICYVVNVYGIKIINQAIQAVLGNAACEVHSMKEIFAGFLPNVSLRTRKAFRNTLVRLSGINELELALEARIYLTSRELRNLAILNFEIGDHTLTHINCRAASEEELASEIDENRIALEAITGRRVRAFSVPYGSSADLTADLVAHLRNAGYQAAFMAEGRGNSETIDCWHLNRVSINTGEHSMLFSEIEVLPRLRSFRNKFAANPRSRVDRSFTQSLHLEGDNIQ